MNLSLQAATMKTRSAIQSFSLRSLALGIVMLAGAASGYVLTAVLLLCASSLLLRYLQDKHAHWRTLGVPSPPATLLVGHTLRRLGLSMPFMTVCLISLLFLSFFFLFFFLHCLDPCISLSSYITWILYISVSSLQFYHYHT